MDISGMPLGNYDEYADLTANGRAEFPFEFERKFWVEQLPAEVLQHGSQQIILQSYVFAEAGYAIRVRLAFRAATFEKFVFPEFDARSDLVGAYERRVLAELLAEDFAEHSVASTLAVKSPPVSGERYELETEINQDVAVQILQRSANLVVKKRYSLWMQEDGWEFDVFYGQNQGLIVAECERTSPVTNLEIPDFCRTEVTGDLRFTNDYLSKEPWLEWDTAFRTELAQRGPRFLDFSA